MKASEMWNLFVALVAGDYEKTIKRVQQALLYDNTKAECYFYLVFSHY